MQILGTPAPPAGPAPESDRSGERERRGEHEGTRSAWSWRTLRHKARELVRRLVRERAAPKEVGQAVAIGVFFGCSPALGLHAWLAVGASTALRRNRLFAFLGSRVSFILILPWIVLAEIESAHWLRTGAFAPIDREHALAEAASYLLDWCLGWLLVGPVLAVLLGLLVMPVWAWWLRRRLSAERTPLPLPPPSSESPR